MKVQDFWKITKHFRGICGIYLILYHEKPKDVNIHPVGLRNIRISTDYAQNLSPDTDTECVIGIRDSMSTLATLANVRGESVFSVMAAGWFCGKSG